MPNRGTALRQSSEAINQDISVFRLPDRYANITTQLFVVVMTNHHTHFCKVLLHQNLNLAKNVSIMQISVVFFWAYSGSNQYIWHMIQPQTDLGKHQTVQSYLCDLDFFSPVKLKKLPVKSFSGLGGVGGGVGSFISSIIELDELWLS